MKLKVFAAVLCIATMGLAISCSKEEKKENATIVGKWKCIYVLVNDYDYSLVDSKIKIDTNYCDYIDNNRIGKKWVFKKDGLSQREGELELQYNIFGNRLTFRKPGDTIDVPGKWTIKELHERYVKLDFVYDRRAANGVGNCLTENYVLSRISSDDPTPDPNPNPNSDPTPVPPFKK